MQKLVKLHIFFLTQTTYNRFLSQKESIHAKNTHIKQTDRRGQTVCKDLNTYTYYRSSIKTKEALIVSVMLLVV